MTSWSLQSLWPLFQSKSIRVEGLLALLNFHPLLHFMCNGDCLKLLFFRCERRDVRRPVGDIRDKNSGREEQRVFGTCTSEQLPLFWPPLPQADRRFRGVLWSTTFGWEDGPLRSPDSLDTENTASRRLLNGAGCAKPLKNLLWPSRSTFTGAKCCVTRFYVGAIGLVDAQSNTEVEHYHIRVE